MSTTAATSSPIIPSECFHSSSQNLLETLYSCFLTLFTQDKPAYLGPLLFRQSPQGAGEHPQAVVHLVPHMEPSKKSFGLVEGLLFGGKRVFGLGDGSNCCRAPLHIRAQGALHFADALKHKLWSEECLPPPRHSPAVPAAHS